MKNLAILFSLILYFIPYSSFSQETPSVDELFEKARKLAFSNHYTEARQDCYKVLQTAPDYLDARILIGRTFAWERQFDSARYHIRTALKQSPFQLDGYLALADIELWSANCEKAKNICDTGLMKNPNNYDLLVRKTKAYICLEQMNDARSTIDSLLKVYPMNLEIQRLLSQTRHGLYKNRIIAEHTFDYFREPYLRRWHVSSLQYQRDSKWGTAIVKANAGQLIPSDGSLWNPGAFQFETDVYPLLGKGYYAYLNYGISDGELFPKHRFGVELFKTFPTGTEVSLGGRYLYYNELADVWILTGSLSQYYKSWWFSFRPYITDINDNWSQAYFFQARYYYKELNYAGILLGYGISPDEFMNSYGFLESTNLTSYQARFDWQHRLSTHFLFRSFCGYAYEKYNPDKFRHRFTTQLYLAYMF